LFLIVSLVVIPLNIHAISFEDLDCFGISGTIVTMESEDDVFRGYVVIKDGLIESVNKNSGSKIEQPGCLIFETDNLIFPALIDTHNHPTWGMFPLWKVPQKFDNRYDWQKDTDYIESVQKPHGLLVDTSNYNYTIEAMKYEEVKSLVGGTTVLQGSYSDQSDGFKDIIVHLIELEQPNGITTEANVGNIRNLNSQQIVEKINDGSLDVFIQHLGEGIDKYSRDEFDVLKKDQLLIPNVVVIHGPAFNQTAFSEMAKQGTKLTWSPLSNLLLYGQTTNIVDAWNEGITVSLAPDWSPSGSKNVLQELKVAWWWNRDKLDYFFSPYNMTQMVTVNPAKAVQWDQYVGKIAPGYSADIMLVDRICYPYTPWLCFDPYMNLVLSGDEGVNLVLVKGRPLYGEIDWFKALGVTDYDTLECNGWQKGVKVREYPIDKGNQTWNKIATNLQEAMKFGFEDMYEKWGQKKLHMSKQEFQAWLTEKFPGLHSTPLTPLYTTCDPDFFKTLENSNDDFKELVEFWKWTNGIGEQDSTIESFSEFYQIDPYIGSPLKQSKAGIAFDNIQCKEGLQLEAKASDNSPVCVKPTSVTKLQERGYLR